MSTISAGLAAMTSERRLYTLGRLPTHLAQAGETERLRRILTDFDFMVAKTQTALLGLQTLIEDYDLAVRDDMPHLAYIQGVLKLSAHIVAQDPTQLAGQLLGRLSPDTTPDLLSLREQAKRWAEVPWLRPLAPSLASPKSSLVRTLTGHTKAVMAVAITLDGQFAISASMDQTLKVWNIDSGVNERTFSGHTDEVHGVAVTPDGRYAVSASSDHTLKVWDIQRGMEHTTLQGHTDAVYAVAILPDGRTVVSGGGSPNHIVSGGGSPGSTPDTTIKIWDLATGRDVTTLHGHTDRSGSLTLFGQALVDGFQGKGDYISNRGGFISAYDLYSHLYDTLQAWVPTKISAVIERAWSRTAGCPSHSPVGSQHDGGSAHGNGSWR